LKDSRLWKLRNAEIKKRRLSHSAYWLLSCLTDWLYNSPNEDHNDFTLTKGRAGKWLGIEDRVTIGNYFKELMKHGILHHMGYTKETPRTAMFRIPLDLLVIEHPPKRKPCAPSKRR